MEQHQVTFTAKIYNKEGILVEAYAETYNYKTIRGYDNNYARFRNAAFAGTPNGGKCIIETGNPLGIPVVACGKLFKYDRP